MLCLQKIRKHVRALLAEIREGLLSHKSGRASWEAREQAPALARRALNERALAVVPFELLRFLQRLPNKKALYFYKAFPNVLYTKVLEFLAKNKMKMRTLSVVRGFAACCAKVAPWTASPVSRS